MNRPIDRLVIRFEQKNYHRVFIQVDEEVIESGVIIDDRC